MRVAPDDDLYRVNAVWLGPRGLTFPWTARYLAYATWLMTFLTIVLVEIAVPALHPGVPPVWEITITTLFTYAVMSFVDHERPVRAVWQTFTSELRTPRGPGKSHSVRVLGKVRVRSRPRHDRRLTRAYFAGTDRTVMTHAERYAAGRSGAGPTRQQQRERQRQRQRHKLRKNRTSRLPATPARVRTEPTATTTTARAVAVTGSGRAEKIDEPEVKPRSRSARVHGHPTSTSRPTLQSPNRAGRR